ncbi:hypothetical protein EJ04DRAFT_588412 [Polyplosphaeria fusca]|uniref:Uncharacterized protein n=1 Tax=Polyplosphaeria fusca TaxID=682080 RepID=A0A9P4UYW7_9PLEO|nr:hypothetical protein EJ04DRAFT_588412 [Polyplosphaeria fusca]
MSELNSRYVKHGYWLNHDKGSVMGKTITTDARSGILTTAVVAVITSLAMAHLWHLITLGYHQFRADGRPHDGLFRQQQSLLRTLPAPSTLLADYVKLWFAWRRTTHKAFARSMFPTIAATSFAAASLAVSIFSSYVVSTNSLEVLPASCPFSEGICASPAIAFDSGLLNLNDMFGINLPDSDSVFYRRRTTCSVLSRDGYTHVAKPSQAFAETLGRPMLPDEEYIFYRYSMDDDDDFSFWQSLALANISNKYANTAGNFYAFNYNATSGPRLIPELRKEDADVMLRFNMNNAVHYRHPVDDPMFAAHREFKITMTTGVNVTVYLSDFPGSVLGCALQFQYCYATSSGGRVCNDLGGLPESDPLEGILAKANSASAWASLQIYIADYAIGPTVRDPVSSNFTAPPATDGEKTLCSAMKMRKQGGFANINVFGLAFTITISGVIVLMDLVLIRVIQFYRTRSKAPTPRLDRWNQDNVYQMSRRAYDSSGFGTWIKLSEEIPITTHPIELPELPHDSTHIVEKNEIVLRVQSSSDRKDAAPEHHEKISLQTVSSVEKQQENPPSPR